MSFDDLRTAMAVALAVFLVVLRLDAQRLGAAEYDELDDEGRRPPFLSRLSWYLLGIALLALVAVVHPDPGRALLLGLGSDRVAALAWGLIFGFVGAAQAVLLAWVRWRRLRLPAGREYPGAILNAVGTAVVDEGAFRGVILGLLVSVGLPGGIAILAQGIGYVLATGVAAPGRDRYTLILTLLLGLTGGVLTLFTGGIGAAVIGHATTRLAMFAMTGHAGMIAPRGRETWEIEEDRLPPPGWEIVEDDE